MDALWTLRMCERFHCLPSALRAEGSDLMAMLEIEGLMMMPGDEA